MALLCLVPVRLVAEIVESIVGQRPHFSQHCSPLEQRRGVWLRFQAPWPQNELHRSTFTSPSASQSRRQETLQVQRPSKDIESHFNDVGGAAARLSFPWTRAPESRMGPRRSMRGACQFRSPVEITCERQEEDSWVRRISIAPRQLKIRTGWPAQQQHVPQCGMRRRSKLFWSCRRCCATTPRLRRRRPTWEDGGSCARGLGCGDQVSQACTLTSVTRSRVEAKPALPRCNVVPRKLIVQSGSGSFLLLQTA